MKWIFGILIIIVLIGAGLYFSTTSNNPATSQPATTPQIITGVDNKTYTDPHLHFTMLYPATAAASDVNYTGYLPLTQNAVVSFTLPKDMFKGTNLGEAGVYIGATTSQKALQSCTNALVDFGEKAAGTQQINGTTFNVFTSTGVGAGNIYDETDYRTVQNGTCIEVVELLHSGNIGNYPPGTTKEFDHPTFKGYLDGMVNTLHLPA